MKKYLIKIGSYSVIFLVVITIIGKLLVDQREKKLIFHPQMRWEEYHNLEANTVDMFFIGSSHCFRSFVPSIIDKKLKLNSFNLGSSSQSIFTSYFVLLEALKTQTPKTVVFEVFNGTFTIEDEFIDLMYNYDYFKSDSVKMEARKSISINENIEILFPAYRFNHNLSLFLKESGVNADLLESSIYSHNGYVETDLPADYFKPSLKIELQEKQLQPKQIQYFEKIVTLLKSSNIDLVLVTQPIHPQYYKLSKDLNRNAFLDGLSKKHDLTYIDFNGMGDFKYRHYYDAHHLNKTGAEKFSQLVSDSLLKLL